MFYCKIAENHCSRPRATQGPESSDTSVRTAASHSTQPRTPRSFWKVDDSRLYKSGSRMSLQVGYSDVGFGPTTESSTMEKSDITLQVLRGPFFSGGGGDPKSRSVFWREGHRKGPETPTTRVKRKCLRLPDCSPRHDAPSRRLLQTRAWHNGTRPEGTATSPRHAVPIATALRSTHGFSTCLPSPPPTGLR